MKTSYAKLDKWLLALLVVTVIAIPILISRYNEQIRHKGLQPETRIFALTGNMEKGWASGDIRAYEVILHAPGTVKLEHPVIQVKKGETVVLKLTSSDVIHGFSLKEFGVYVEDGVLPGKVKTVTFVADKVGKFQFSCNAICGENHENMQGTLVVTG